MAEFVYNNAKNASIQYIFFELNYDYYSHVFFEEETDTYFQFKIAKNLTNNPRDLITINQKDLF